AAIHFLAFHYTDASDHLGWSSLEPQHPVPGIAPFHRWKGHVPAKLVSAIRRVWPRDLRGQVADDLPLREQDLYLLSVGKFHWTQDQPWSLQDWNHYALKRSAFTQPSRQWLSRQAKYSQRTGIQNRKVFPSVQVDAS